MSYYFFVLPRLIRNGLWSYEALHVIYYIGRYTTHYLTSYFNRSFDVSQSLRRRPTCAVNYIMEVKHIIIISYDELLRGRYNHLIGIWYTLKNAHVFGDYTYIEKTYCSRTRDLLLLLRAGRA